MNKAILKIRRVKIIRITYKQYFEKHAKSLNFLTLIFFSQNFHKIIKLHNKSKQIKKYFFCL